MKLLPLGSRYLLKKIETKTETGGLVIPNSVEEKTMMCTIEAKGDASDLRPSLVPTAKVMVLKSLATPLKINNEQYFVVYEHEIMGLVEE